MALKVDDVPVSMITAKMTQNTDRSNYEGRIESHEQQFFVK